ncbi:MAG TPA: TorF family putative porin [Burkholderiales bacterium]
MRKSIASVAVAAALAVPGLAFAQAASPIAGNVSLVSDYRFRGITQTFEEPALQGGFDYAHSSGFYVGNWNSSIADTFFAGSPLEMDFYAGYKPTFGDVTLDLGVLYYYYPGSDPEIDNTELYVGAAWKWLSAKYFHAVSDFFGVPDTKNSNYIDLSANFAFGAGWGLVGHIGHQKIKNNSAADYTDYRLGVTKDLSGWVLGVAYVDNDAEGTITSGAGKSMDIGDSTLVFSVSKTF